MSDYGQNGFPSFAETIGGMFGLGPVFRMMNDPAFQQHMFAMMQSIMQSAEANLRMEAKLDFILKELGHDPAAFDEARRRAGGYPALLAGYGVLGAGADPAPSGAADNGSGAASPLAAEYYPHTDGVYD